jgi:CheY-like chemotaxis protein
VGEEKSRKGKGQPAVKIFLLDDSDALGRYIVGANPNEAVGKTTGPGEPSPNEKSTKFKSATMEEMQALRDELKGRCTQESEKSLEKSRVGFDVYCLEPGCYQKSQDIDAFFHTLLNQKVWRRIDDAGKGAAGTGVSLLALTKAKTDSRFLINVNLKLKPFSARQHQEGVELLKHIRLTEELGAGRDTHVILYSFEEQLQLLRRKPGNLILLSERVTFFRLPEDLKKMADPEELANFADKRAHVEWKEFKRFVQCDYQPPDSAHQFSNWWGLRQIARARVVLRIPEAEGPPDVDKLEDKKTLFLNAHEPGVRVSLPRKPSGGPFKIVYIDDEQGWGVSLKPFLEKDLGSSLKIHYQEPPPKSFFNSTADLKTWLMSHALQKDSPPSLVLLDLRLLGGAETNTPVKDTSGAKIAAMIRKLEPGLPIILMTASNKAHTFQAAMELGIDGYWMKEGVGEHAPQGGNVENYVGLLLLISKALGPEYQFLRLFSQKVGDLKNSIEPNWWESHPWRDRTTTTADRKTVGDILDGIVILLREYLRLFCMSYGFKGEGGRIEQAWICSLMVESAKLLELVHQLHSYRKCKSSSSPKRITLSLQNLLTIRNDEWGMHINEYRNLAAHAQGERIELKWEHARCFLSCIMTWLSTHFDVRNGHHMSDTSFFQQLNGRSLPDFPGKPDSTPWLCPDEFLALIRRPSP